MKAKYKKFSNAYMLYLRLRHIYGKGAGFGKDITFLAIKDRWKKAIQNSLGKEFRK